MPELPEVETVVRTLEHKIAGRTIKNVRVLWPNLIAYPETEAFCRQLVNQRFCKFGRRGKFLIFTLTDYVLVAHLRMEGKFYVYPEPTEPVKHTHIVFELDQGELHYNDVRKFGRFELYARGESLAVLEELGKEPFDPSLTGEQLKRFCRKKKTPIKSQLLDQHMIAGIGNIYANEICHAVRLFPETPSCFISEEKWDEIIAATARILKEAIEMGGTTIRSYTSSLGVTGLFQQKLAVHGQVSKPCPDCGTEIVKKFVEGRGTYYCPSCQKARPIMAAVSGNIGSGKSTVMDLLAEKGYATVKTDELNAEVLQLRETKEHLAALYGCQPEEITKDVIRNTIYSDADLKKKTEEYLHGRIWEMVLAFAGKHQNEKVVFVEVPLLFEAGWNRRFDFNILVCASRQTISKRLQESRKMTKEDIERVLNSQLADTEKKDRCDWVITNDGQLAVLQASVEKLLAFIVK